MAGDKIKRTESTPKLTSIADTVRTEGFGWVWRRLRYRTPATTGGRAVHAWMRRGLSALLAPLRRRASGALPVAGDTLYAFFDLQVAPVTYDASWFAVSADLARRRMGLAHIHFVIVPGRKGGVREERAAYEAVVDAAARRWRVHNLVVPIFNLVPACTGYTVLPARSAAPPWRVAAGEHVYPDHYEPALPVGQHPSNLLAAARRGAEIGILRSPAQSLRYIDQWMVPRVNGRKLITITLRDYGFMTARNSDLGAWASFARRLDRGKYLPVFVLDTERTLDPLPSALDELEVFREASWSVELRMALYETSYLNLGVNNGPLFTAVKDCRVRLLIFKIVTESVPQATADFMRQLGFEIGAQLPFTTPFQKLVWEDDTLPVIEREFEAMIARIEGAEKTEAAIV